MTTVLAMLAAITCVSGAAGVLIATWWDRYMHDTPEDAAGRIIRRQERARARQARRDLRAAVRALRRTPTTPTARDITCAPRHPDIYRDQEEAC